LEIWLGLLLQAVAQAGRPVVAFTAAWVKVAQKAEAVAWLALMKLAQALLLGSRHPRAAGRKPRRA
jgi:hypothetical protein